MSRLRDTVLPPAATFVLTTAAAEIAIRAAHVSPLLLPTPSAVVRAAVAHAPTLLPALATTAKAVAIGLSLSIAVGLVVAIALSASRFVERAFYPYAIFFQIVPIVAIAPLLVIWFGFGDTTVRASAFIVSLFPILANTLTGLEETDPLLRELFALYKPSKWKMIRSLQIPSAIPYILTGLRISVGLATIGAIVGEFIAGGGLGSLIDSARTQQRVDLVFGGVLASSVLALFLVMTIDLASRLLLGRRPYTRSS